jgi:hypothetical protein
MWVGGGAYHKALRIAGSAGAGVIWIRGQRRSAELAVSDPHSTNKAKRRWPMAMAVGAGVAVATSLLSAWHSCFRSYRSYKPPPMPPCPMPPPPPSPACAPPLMMLCGHDDARRVTEMAAHHRVYAIGLAVLGTPVLLTSHARQT